MATQIAVDMRDGREVALSTGFEDLDKLIHGFRQGEFGILAGLVNRLRQTHKIGVVFVDYLQLTRSSKRTESRQQEITEISAKLKDIALRENIPVVALSQLNRQVDARENSRWPRAHKAMVIANLRFASRQYVPLTRTEWQFEEFFE